MKRPSQAHSDQPHDARSATHEVRDRLFPVDPVNPDETDAHRFSRPPQFWLAVVGALGVVSLVYLAFMATNQSPGGGAAMASDLRADTLVRFAQTGSSDIFGMGSMDNIKSAVTSAEAAGSEAAAASSGMVAFVQAPDTSRTFRTVSWGMSMKDVRAHETARLTSESATSLHYRDQRSGRACNITYSFKAGKLSGAFCKITSPIADPALYYRKLEGLTLYFCKVLGEPTVSDYRWTNTSYQNDRSKWGLAMSKGWLTGHFVWDGVRTKVDLTASSASGTFQTDIELSAR